MMSSHPGRYDCPVGAMEHPQPRCEDNERWNCGLKGKFHTSPAGNPIASRKHFTMKELNLSSRYPMGAGDPSLLGKKALGALSLIAGRRFQSWGLGRSRVAW